MKILQRIVGDKWRQVGGSNRLVDRLGHSLPKFLSRPWWDDFWVGMVGNSRRVILPEGYPNTVHKHYASFTTWNFVHMTTSCAVGVLSTQSLLFGLGLSSGALPLSATLNWILKDGLGQLGGVLAVAYLGSSFDIYAKRYRFLGAFLLKTACFIELLVPLVPGHFVLVAAAANVLKNIAWMATSATRAQIHRHFARKDNMGDLSGKAAAQNTLASLIGTGIGISCSLMTTASTPTGLISSFLYYFIPLSMISLVSVYQSCQYAVSPRLTVNRLEIILFPLLAEVLVIDKEGKVSLRSDVLGQLSRYLLDPDTVAQRERFLGGNPKMLIRSLSLIPLHIEPPLKSNQELQGLGPSWVTLTDRAAVSVWFSENATDYDILYGLVKAMILRYLTGKGIIMSEEEMETITLLLYTPLRDALLNRGWDLQEIYLGRRHPLLLFDNKLL